VILSDNSRSLKTRELSRRLADRLDRLRVRYTCELDEDGNPMLARRRPPGR